MTWSSWYTAAGAGLLLCFWVVGAHNRLMGLRSAIHAAWPPLDKLLTERGQALVQLCEGLRPHLPNEQETLDACLAAVGQVRVATETVRSRPSSADAVARLVAAEAALEPSLARLSALQAPGGDLPLDAALAEALAALPLLQAQRAYARDAFNQAVAAYNAAAHQFPTQMLTPLLRFGRAGAL